MNLKINIIEILIKNYGKRDDDNDKKDVENIIDDKRIYITHRHNNARNEQELRIINNKVLKIMITITTMMLKILLYITIIMQKILENL